MVGATYGATSRKSRYGGRWCVKNVVVEGWGRPPRMDSRLTAGGRMRKALPIPSARLPHLTAHDVAEIDAEVRAVLQQMGDGDAEA